ncbi:FtsQ-type POTRA domain-containing protein [Streptomyces sp. V4-01]|uniref:Cell division protein FtsQ n=1 Tax=Actinacidiphila polyblastidii TaxID=3110430 RepID=A0ABU7P6Y1_9ACTN|nr:FtsQ-type POTRA domain-containing protein [Streptomyces sp. V4-01]
MTGTETGALGAGPAPQPRQDARPAPPVRQHTGRTPRRGGPRFTAPARRTALVALIVLTVLVGAGTWALYGSSWFRADRVAVAGNSALTTGQIERAAAVPLGGPLLSVDTGAVRGRLLAALPRIGRVEVGRSWPHTITVRITERTAAAVLRSGARFTEVDRDGVRFATVDRAPAGVPVLRLEPDRAGAAASLRQFGTTRLLQAAIAVAGDLPDVLRGRATAIRVRSYDGITVELSGGREVVWGSAEDGALKAAALTALMKVQPHADHFDVSAPTAPAASHG